MKPGVLETLLMTALFAAAIASVGAITAAATKHPQVSLCAGLMNDGGPTPGSHAETLQPHAVED